MAITGNNIVEGTFTAAPTTSAPCNGKEFTVALDFAGTASVDIEVNAGAGWFKHTTAIAADKVQSVEFKTRCQLRLNCTAHTDDVVYKIVAAR